MSARPSIRRSVGSSIVRSRRTAAACFTSSGVISLRRSAPGSVSGFSGRVRANSARSIQPRARAVLVLGAGRAQPAVALRENAGALAAALRRGQPPSPVDVRRTIRTRLATVLDRLAGIVFDRFAAAVPGRICPRQHPGHAADARWGLIGINDRVLLGSARFYRVLQGFVPRFHKVRCE